MLVLAYSHKLCAERLYFKIVACYQILTPSRKEMGTLTHDISRILNFSKNGHRSC